MPDRSSMSKKTANRSGRAGATAAVLKWHHGALVLLVDDVVTKNERHRVIRHGRASSLAESRVAVAFKAAVARAAEGGPVVESGLWHLEVLAVWPTQRHLPSGEHTANGDSDASLSMVKDALQAAGVLDDDVRVVSDGTRAAYEKGQRRLVAILTKVRPEDHERSAASTLLWERWVKEGNT